jgi:hypothetical protein
VIAWDAPVTPKENAMIMPHATGHAFARDGCLLRVDIMSGRWVATRFAPNLVVTQQVLGSDDAVHRQIKHWLLSPLTGREPRNVARAFENANATIRLAEEKSVT